MNALKHLMFAVAGFGLMASGQIALAQETPTTAPAGVKLVEAKAVQALQAQGRHDRRYPQGQRICRRQHQGRDLGPLRSRRKAPRTPTSMPRRTSSTWASSPTRTRTIVVFCNSGTCWKSYKAAVVTGQKRLQERPLVPQRLPGLESAQAADGINSRSQTSNKPVPSLAALVFFNRYGKGRRHQ